MTDSAAMQTVSVLIPLALPGPYDYAVPANMAVVPGTIVRVPLGPREVYGVVWGDALGDAAPHKIKPIADICDVPPLAEELRRFCRLGRQLCYVAARRRIAPSDARAGGLRPT